jgi:fumarate reductase flavoprotein subunit
MTLAEAVELVDVVVVGGGGSGLAAAVSAAQRGVSVLVLEKQPQLGGTTAMSVGSLTAAGTRLQRRAGVQDSAEAFEEDMVAFDPDLLTGDAPHLRRVLAVEAASTLAWLESLGVAFVGPYEEPPHRVPRMHNVVPSSRSYVDRLSDAASRLGVRCRVGTDVVELVREGDRVTGVRTRDLATGEDRLIVAGLGVVLASGDFSGNAEMRREFLPEEAAAALPINATADGDGHRLGVSAGGLLKRMDVTFGPQLRFPPSPRPGLIDRLPTWRRLCKLEAMFVQRLPAAALRPFVKSLLITHMSPTTAMFEAGAVLVNTQGRRFCDEKVSVGPLSSQPEARGFIVFDESIARTFNTPPHSISTAPGVAFAYFDDYRRGRPDLVSSAATIPDLARALGVPVEALESSTEQAGFRPPFHALGPVHSMLTVTEGGLEIDTSMCVIRADGEPVEGLLAVGGVGQGGLMLKGHGHHIGWAMTSGRIAGETLARRRPAGSSVTTSAGGGQ